MNSRELRLSIRWFVVAIYVLVFSAVMFTNLRDVRFEIAIGASATMRVECGFGWIHAIIVGGAGRLWHGARPSDSWVNIEFAPDFTSFVPMLVAPNMLYQLIINSFMRTTVFVIPNSAGFDWSNGTVLTTYTSSGKPSSTLRVLKLSIRSWLVSVLMSVPLCIAFLKKVGRKRRRESIHCSKCDYNLTGNVSGVCPECGTAISPAPSGPRVSGEAERK